MTQHLINTLRKSIVGAVLMLLPASPPKTVEPEPIRRPLRPEPDTWLFDAERSVKAHADDYFGAMDRLQDQLAGLHSLLSTASISEPVVSRVNSAPVFGAARLTAIWSDTMLFDGEPYLLDATPADMDAPDDLLFGIPNDKAMPNIHVIAAQKLSVHNKFNFSDRRAA